MTTKQQEFLDILTNPRRVEIKRKVDELMLAYADHLEIENSFQIKLIEHPEYTYVIRITTENKQVLHRTEDWFRHYFPAHKYPTSIYAPPKNYDPERWTHYYCITDEGY